MDKKIKKRYCIDEKLNRHARRKKLPRNDADEFMGAVVWGIDLLL